MNGRFSKLKNWVSGKFQFVTLVLLIFALSLLVKQQNDISHLKKQIDSIESNVDGISDLESKIDDIEEKIDGVESTLSDDIEEVRKTIIRWSN